VPTPPVPPIPPEEEPDMKTSLDFGHYRAPGQRVPSTDSTEQLPVSRRRDTPPPVVSAPGMHTRGARGIPPLTEAGPVTVINAILDERDQRERRAGPNRSAPSRPTVRDIAADRLARAEREERHRNRHQRHMDALEAARGWLGVLCLFGLLMLVVFMGVIAVGLLSGWYVWVPVRH